MTHADPTHVVGMQPAEITTGMLIVPAYPGISGHHRIADPNVQLMQIVPTLWLALVKNAKNLALAFVVKTLSAMSRITMLFANA